MKRVSFIISFFIHFVASAQNTPPQISAALNKFVGTWVYKKGQKEVTIILKKIQVPVSLKTYTIDDIDGYHIYKVNNKTVDNSLERNVFSLTAGYIEERDKPNKIKINYYDFIKKKSCDAILIILPGDTAKMQLVLRNKEGFRLHKPGEPEFDKTFTLPETMILERQN